ncbi:metal-dependent transcriptional regulator [soil metagenome]
MNISTEDYIKNIYSIDLAVGKVTTSILAEKLKVSSAAVSEMISKLSANGYVKNIPYKGFELTKKGRSVAVNIIRKHRLWEVFLLQYLKFPWEKVHVEAEKLEHSSSDELIEKLEQFLNFPKYDPHGDPIPDKNGKYKNLPLIPLADIKVGEAVRIKKVSDEDPGGLIYLTKNGIRLEDKIKVRDKTDFDSSMEVESNHSKIFISEKLSKIIFVIKII